MRFGAFSFDPTTMTLSRDGVAVPLGNRAAKLLTVLLNHRGEPVAKEALMDAAWPGQAVEESNLTVQMAALRKALGTTSEGHDWIATVPRIGYRFINSAASTHAADKQKPSIAVLPFANLSSDTEQDYFAAGLAEDLITDLSKVHGLLVISRDSSFAFKDAPEPDSIAGELGVQYLVRGSVRRAADKVRINAWLIDAAEASPIWADRFDGDLVDVFALQDQVVGRIVRALSDVLPIGAAPQPRRQPVLEAYDAFARGRQLVMQSPQGNLAGRELLEQAARMDPGFAEPHAWMAMSFVHGWLTWGQPLDGTATKKAVEAGRRAVALDDRNADAHAFLGYALGFDRKPEEAEAEMAVALRLNPNHADAMALHAELLVNAGRIEPAVAAMEQAMRLNPYPPPWYRWMQGFILHASGMYEEAVATLTHETMRGTASGRILSASLAQLGRMDEARAAAREFLRIVPSFRIAEWVASQPLVDDTIRGRFVEGYHKAGLPD